MTVIIDMLPVGMFLFLFVLLALGVPVAFSLFGVSIAFCLLAWGTSGMPIIVSSVFGSINNFTLVAIPLFILMSVLLEKSKIVEELFDVLYKISWRLRGGLAIAAIVVGAILGAISGVVAAGVIGLGMIALPQMLKYRYNRKLSLGAVMAGGTLGQLIPPSLNMVVFGAITGVSVANLFAGGLSAGILLAALYVVFIFATGIIKPSTFPKLSGETQAPQISAGRVARGLVLPAVLIVVVLGTILSGVATPTEGAAIGVIGTLALAAFSGGLKWTLLKDACWSSTKTTGMIIWILAGAAAFSAVFAGIGGLALVRETAALAPGGKWGILIFGVIFLFVLGMFLETMAVILLAAPILTPIITEQGFDSLWWALLFMVILQTAYLTPPFGFAIFYLKSVTIKAIRIGEIYRATLPFIALQVVFIVACIVFPGILIWLPNLLE